MLIDKIRAKIESAALDLPIPAKLSEIQELEETIGLKIPQILKDCLVGIANGGFGPGYGLIGVKRIHAGDFGDLEQTYRIFHTDPTVSANILPFCYWGEIVFSCVDCTTGKIWVLSGGIPHKTFETPMSMDDFFEKWIVDSPELLSSLQRERKLVRVVRHPVTGEDIEIYSSP